MTAIRVLITGGYGCIGSESAKWLLDNTDASVVVASRSVTPERTAKVFGEVERSRLTSIALDVTDQQHLESALVEHGITHVIHMAALQTPDCNANRDLGLQINLAGTQNLIEAMKAVANPIERFIFASSIAIYGPRSAYPSGIVPTQSEPMPVNVYGAWKWAGEQLARFFHEDEQVPTVSLRPGVLFGPGRDAGLTSSPTTAIKCVALGRPYEVPFNTRQDYQYVADVGAAVGHTLLDPYQGYNAFTLPSHTATTEQFVEGLRQAANELGVGDQFQISVGNEEVPFICDLEDQPFISAFPNVPRLSLHEAIKKSLEVFLQQVDRGQLSAKNVPPLG